MIYDTLPDRSPRFAYAPTGVVRMRCECCDCPTLPLVADTAMLEVDWESSRLACLLCDWESGPALEDGTPDPTAPSAASRNEGYALDEARANVQRYGWMYDPAAPPLWMGGAPTTEELALRRALLEAYAELDAAAERRERGAAWERIVPLEAQLRDAAEARRDALEEAQDDGDAVEYPTDG